MFTTTFSRRGTWWTFLNPNSWERFGTTSDRYRSSSRGVISEHLGREGDDLHELAGPQLARDGTEDARADRFLLVVEDHGRVVVEPDERPVAARDRARGPHDHRAPHLALLDPGIRDRVLHGHHDQIADRGIAAPGAAEHADARNLARARVVGDFQYGFCLDHDRFP